MLCYTLTFGVQTLQPHSTTQCTLLQPRTLGTVQNSMQTSSAPSSRFSSCLSLCDRFGSRIHRITCVIISINAFSITNITNGLQPHSKLYFMAGHLPQVPL